MDNLFFKAVRELDPCHTTGTLVHILDNAGRNVYVNAADTDNRLRVILHHKAALGVNPDYKPEELYITQRTALMLILALTQALSGDEVTWQIADHLTDDQAYLTESGKGFVRELAQSINVGDQHD